MWRNLAKGIERWGGELTTPVKKEMEMYWKDYVTKTVNVKNPSNGKYYVLSMFPYPSGNLHMGHVRVYSISDSIARFQRMNGHDVIHPMGWDAFGLPAENAAIERKISPADWTRDNVAKMKEQLVHLGCNFDWDREINTSDPSYYKWTQKIFLELFKAGLAYKKEALVNWDPIDKTVLADEQVDINGCSWRSGAKVEKKLLNQWFVRTTYFAQQLYEGLNDPSLVNWKDIVQMQKHWIGECDGTTIDFELHSPDPSYKNIKILTAWTNEPESLLFSKFVAVPPSSILNDEKLVLEKNQYMTKLSVTAKNPITEQTLPVFITDFITYPEGSDAHVGSPQLNEVDREFYSSIERDEMIDSISFSDSERLRLRRDVCNVARRKNVGGYAVSSKLKDWLISRQRYWGTPIPVVHCERCGSQPVPEGQLPVILPTSNSSGDAESWKTSTCPSCKGEAVRETDTMDTFVDSSWYFLRYLDPRNECEPFSEESVRNNMPVDVYVGGKEHATLHLYYSRFVCHFLNSIGKVPVTEPFSRLLVQGMVMGKSYRIKSTGKYIPESEVRVTDEKGNTALKIEDNQPVDVEWEKMSKSKHNGVDPSKMFDEYSSDTTRLIMLADVSPMSHRHWSKDTFPGIINWQNRLWLTVNDFISLRSDKTVLDAKSIVDSDEFKSSELKLAESRNYFIVSATYNYNYTHQLSVAISNMQGLTNALRKTPRNYVPLSGEYEKLLAIQLIMLAPVAPHFASELWVGFAGARNRIGEDVADWDRNVLDQRWPVVDSHYKLDLLCLVDGGDCGRTKFLPADLNELTQEAALEAVMTQKKVQRKVKSGVAETYFRVYPNCRAIIIITTNHQVTQREKNKALAAQSVQQ